MKILILAAADSNHTKKWVNSLAIRGYDVLLVSRMDQTGMISEISSKVQYQSLRFGGGIGYYLNSFQLRRILRQFNPDVVNAHYATGYGTLARISNARPFVISCYGSDVYDFPYHSNFNLKLLKKNLFWADAIASTSESMAEHVKKILSEDNLDITVTPFGVDTDVFKLFKKKCNKRPVIGIVKYLEPVYDIELLIKAFSIVCKTTKYDPVLMIYGGGSLENELRLLSEELCVSESVIFKGTVKNEEIPEALNEFDIFVNCSKMESFGVTVVEAMSCECPVIVTQTEGYKEIVVDGETGIVLSDREPETMAKAMVYLLDDQEKRIKMGKQGRKRVKEKYDWEKNVMIMERLFHNVAQKYKKEC